MKVRYEEAIRGTSGTNTDPNSQQKSMGKDVITIQNELKVVNQEIEELKIKNNALSKLWQL